MDTLTPTPDSKLTTILRHFDIRPNKALGQNFLANGNVLGKITAAAELTRGDTVLEIGPGVGSLTWRLANEADQVVAVELDGRLIPVLHHVLSGLDNVTVIEGDILALDPGKLMGTGGYKVVANIPYNITSALFRHLLESAARPSMLVLTVQEEVARRVCAGPGEMSLLSVSVQYYGQPRIVARIPAGAFYPPPKVDSAVVRVDVFDQPAVQGVEPNTFFRVVKAGFSQKRKQLRNALSGGLGVEAEHAARLLEAVGIDPRRRAETVAMAEWGALAVHYIRAGKTLRKRASSPSSKARSPRTPPA